jgi:uncharacterized low-complexity protein
MKKSFLNLRKLGLVVVAASAMAMYSCGEESHEEGTENTSEEVVSEEMHDDTDMKCEAGKCEGGEATEASCGEGKCDGGDASETEGETKCDGGDASETEGETKCDGGEAAM